MIGRVCKTEKWAHGSQGACVDTGWCVKCHYTDQHALKHLVENNLVKHSLLRSNKWVDAWRVSVAVENV